MTENDENLFVSKNAANKSAEGPPPIIDINFFILNEFVFLDVFINVFCCSFFNKGLS